MKIFNVEYKNTTYAGEATEILTIKANNLPDAIKKSKRFVPKKCGRWFCVKAEFIAETDN